MGDFLLRPFCKRFCIEAPTANCNPRACAGQALGELISHAFKIVLDAAIESQTPVHETPRIDVDEHAAPNRQPAPDPLGLLKARALCG